MACIFVLILMLYTKIYNFALKFLYHIYQDELTQLSYMMWKLINDILTFKLK